MEATAATAATAGDTAGGTAEDTAEDTAADTQEGMGAMGVIDQEDMGVMVHMEGMGATEAATEAVMEDTGKYVYIICNF